MHPSDFLSALLDRVPAAAREDDTQAIDPRDAPSTRSAPPPIDKRALARALCSSSAPVDRVCRPARIPYARVGDLHRVDAQTVHAAFRATAPGPVNAPRADPRANAGPRRSIGPCNDVGDASHWRLSPVPHEERLRDGATADQQDGRRIGRNAPRRIRRTRDLVAYVARAELHASTLSDALHVPVGIATEERLWSHRVVLAVLRSRPAPSDLQ